MSTMTIERNLPGMDCEMLIEPEINHLASTYAAEHLKELVNEARKCPEVDPSKIEDLVQDLIESLLKSEEAGKGYSIDYSNNGSVITVAEFVFGRLKRYAMNTKYKVISERHTSNKNINGENKAVVDFEIHYASYDEGADIDQLSSMQRAYAMAKSYDSDIEEVDNRISLRQNIELCLGFNDVVGFNLLNLFKNIDMFSEGEFDDGIFTTLRKAVSEHDQLKDAIQDVIMFSASDHGAFEEVLAEFN